MPVKAKSADRPVSVMRVHPAIFWASLFFALLLQLTLPVKIPLARLFDFPVLLTIYFAATRRSKVFGIVLGTGLGIMQDALSHGLLGMFGIADALAGYLAGYAAVKFDMEQLGARYFLAAGLVLVHNLAIETLGRILFGSVTRAGQPELIAVVVVNTGLALLCYPVLDRFRRQT